MSKRKINQALRHVGRVEEALDALTRDKISELVSRSRFDVLPDGHPRRTLADGMPRGEAALTSVEAAAETRGAFPDSQRPDDDPVGRAIRESFDLLREMADRAAQLSRKLAYLDHSHLHDFGRVSSLAGECVACGDSVSGSEKDRLRSGLCSGCYEARRSSGISDRQEFIFQRRRELDEERSA